MATRGLLQAMLDEDRIGEICTIPLLAVLGSSFAAAIALQAACSRII